MRTIHRSASLAATGLALSLLATACTNASATVSPPSGAQSPAAAVSVDEAARALLPQDVRERGTLVIASDPSYAPFEFMDTDNKTMIGWDVDMGRAVAESLGLKAQNTAATFETILPGLTSRKYDLGMSAFSVTPEREKAVDFVRYLNGGSGLAVAPGNPLKLSMTAETLCGKRIAAQKGSSQALETMPAFNQKCLDAGKAPIDQQQFPLQSDANLALMSGRVDGVMADSVSLAYQGKLANNKFELAAGDDYDPAPVGIALPKGSPLKPAVEAAVKGIITSGEYARLNEKWSLPASISITADKVSGS